MATSTLELEPMNNKTFYAQAQFSTTVQLLISLFRKDRIIFCLKVNGLRQFD